MSDLPDPRAGLGASLDTLALDHVDLFLIHWPAPATDSYLEALPVLEELRDEGLTRSIGVSNFLPEHLERLVGLGASVPTVNQVELHPALQNRNTAAANREHGVVTEAWSPLAQGAVLGEEAIVRIARDHDVSPAQVVIRWHLQQGRIVIPKSVTPSRIRENFNVFGFTLSSDELLAIDELDRNERTGLDSAEFNG